MILYNFYKRKFIPESGFIWQLCIRRLNYNSPPNNVQPNIRQFNNINNFEFFDPIADIGNFQRPSLFSNNFDLNRFDPNLNYPSDEEEYNSDED